MESVLYQPYRSNIKSGDLLVWSKDSFSVMSNVYLTGIRLLTVSSYAHVGVAWRLADRLFVIEATMPRIRLVPVSLKDEFYHIPIGFEPTNSDMIFLFEKIGLEYSLRDATRAYFGKTVKADDKWQCVELANEFYKHANVIFSDHYRPDTFIDEVMTVLNVPIIKVKAS